MLTATPAGRREPATYTFPVDGGCLAMWENKAAASPKLLQKQAAWKRTPLPCTLAFNKEGYSMANLIGGIQEAAMDVASVVKFQMS